VGPDGLPEPVPCGGVGVGGRGVGEAVGVAVGVTGAGAAPLKVVKCSGAGAAAWLPSRLMSNPLMRNVSRHSSAKTPARFNRLTWNAPRYKKERLSCVV